MTETIKSYLIQKGFKMEDGGWRLTTEYGEYYYFKGDIFFRPNGRYYSFITLDNICLKLDTMNNKVHELEVNE